MKALKHARTMVALRNFYLQAVKYLEFGSPVTVSYAAGLPNRVELSYGHTGKSTEICL
jgi:hypothetical protein